MCGMCVVCVGGSEEQLDHRSPEDWQLGLSETGSPCYHSGHFQVEQF